MASTPPPPTLQKLGKVYSWLIRQPANFASGVKSVSDAEKLYDGYAMLGIENIFDNYEPVHAIALIGYDPASVTIPVEATKKVPVARSRKRGVSLAA